VAIFKLLDVINITVNRFEAGDINLWNENVILLGGSVENW